MLKNAECQFKTLFLHILILLYEALTFCAFHTTNRLCFRFFFTAAIVVNRNCKTKMWHTTKYFAMRCSEQRACNRPALHDDIIADCKRSRTVYDLIDWFLSMTANIYATTARYTGSTCLWYCGNMTAVVSNRHFRFELNLC